MKKFACALSLAVVTALVGCSAEAPKTETAPPMPPAPGSAHGTGTPAAHETAAPAAGEGEKKEGEAAAPAAGEKKEGEAAPAEAKQPE